MRDLRESPCSLQKGNGAARSVVAADQQRLALAKGQLELVFGSNGVLKFGLLGDLLSWPGKLRAALGKLLPYTLPLSLDQVSGRECTA